ncbi:phosphotransferase family protein [Mycobacterium sp. NAZ190054]|uniref:phosphotransferase family protein n=1 Tax=Mycobacterium sp. NAZ190054 TaxID=1747766 RepID=UPI000796DE2B|nr:phosphotransferase family protein [Mycobacterium sp. NAZ190054]KWX57517.1 hypothetical protein ASJ79_11220 [Mycobacterium sp. NAZ190054]
MTHSATSDAAHLIGVDPVALSEWLAGHVPAVSGPVSVKTIAAGRSNLTYLLVDDTGGRFVLRRPPLGRGGAHDISREARLLSALHGNIDVPALVAECHEPAVIGAPFLIMSFEDGYVVSRENAEKLTSDAKQSLGQSVPDKLAELHALDLDHVGLGDMRRPRTFVQRQLKVWRRQLDGLDVPARVHQVAAILESDEPAESKPVLLHGDYKLENLICTAGGDVTAILDWELAAVGDPMADLGWLLAWWAEPGDPGRWIVPPASTAGGFPRRRDVAEVYAQRTGIDVGTLPYYTAFAFWRLSCINTTTRARFVAGAMADKVMDLDALDQQIDWQLDRAAALLAGDRL